MVLWFTYQSSTQREDVPGDTTHVRVEQGVTQIQRELFNNLYEPDEGEGEREIGKHDSLQHVEIATSVQSIDRKVFMCCRQLVMLSIPKDSTLTTIGYRAFAYTGLKEVVLPESLRKISHLSFAVCCELKRVVIGGTSNRPSQLVVLGVACFQVCLKLKEVDLSSCLNLTVLRDACFSDCTSLEQILLPPKLREIGERAFQRCSSLSEITFPKTLASIGQSAFVRCDLEQIVFPRNVRTIDDEAFSFCRHLKRIEFESISTMGEVLTPTENRDPPFHHSTLIHTILWPQVEVSMSLWPRLVVLLFGAQSTRMIGRDRSDANRISGVFAALCHHHDKLVEQQNRGLGPRRSWRRRQPIQRYGAVENPSANGGREQKTL